MLIAEDLVLVCYDDESGRAQFDATKVEYALAGAVLIELALLGRIGVAGPGEAVRAGRLVRLDGTPTGDDVLDVALTDLADDEGAKPKNVLGSLRKGLREKLLERLVERGLLRQEKGKILGLFPTTRWPAADATHEQQVRQQLHAALVAGADPDPRTAALVSLLVAVDGIGAVVPAPDRKAAQCRAKEIAAGEWAAQAVRQAVDEVNAAVLTAVVAATVTTTVTAT